jgi:hypothetical protein
MVAAEQRLEPTEPTPEKYIWRDAIDSLDACINQAGYVQECMADLEEALVPLAPPQEVIDAWNIITGWLLTAMGAWGVEKRDLEDREEGYSPC